MYTITAGTTVICNSNISKSAVINPVINREANKAETFVFTLPPDHEYYDLIESKKTIIEANDETGKMLFRGLCNNQTLDLYNNKKVECIGELSYLNDSILRQMKYASVDDASTLLFLYMDLHNEQVDDYKKFRLGEVTVHSNGFFTRFTNYNSTWKEIKEDLIDNFGGYIRVRREGQTNYLDYLAESPKESKQIIKLGYNLVNYSCNIDAQTICTRVIPLGAKLDEQVIEGLDAYLTIESVNSGKDYLTSSADIVNRYGIVTEVARFDDIHVPSILKTRGQKYLTDSQFENVKIECTAIDLGYLGETEKFELLDTVRIISEPHGMDKKFILTKMKINLNNPDKDLFTFTSLEKMGMTFKS